LTFLSRSQTFAAWWPSWLIEDQPLGFHRAGTGLNPQTIIGYRKVEVAMLIAQVVKYGNSWPVCRINDSYFHGEDHPGSSPFDSLDFRLNTLLWLVSQCHQSIVRRV
jgi:hypothetical protein